MRTVPSPRVLILGVAALFLLFAATPGVVGHSSTCYGGATQGGLCLILCDQEHRITAGPHACYYVPSPICSDIAAVESDSSMICLPMA